MSIASALQERRRALPSLVVLRSRPAQRDWLLDDIWSEFQTTVAADASSRPAVSKRHRTGTLQPRDAIDAHLLDGTRQRQDLTSRYTEDDGSSRLVSVQDYRKAGTKAKHGRAIAVVHTSGFILSGKNSYNPVVGTVLGDASVVRDLEAAVHDKDVAAIVLRIDSPGGDILASDAISHAVRRVNAAKPVVISMVDVAASGGYMMAYRASRIIALSTTVTGSIGSITGKLNVHGLYASLGQQGFRDPRAYPFLDSDYFDWTAREESLVTRQHWQDYNAWIGDVAEHRGMSVADVDSVARGRVWTGAQALERKLVDEVGDMRHAAGVAQELARIPASESSTVPYPKEMDPRRAHSLLIFAESPPDFLRSARLPQSAAWSVLDLRR